MQVGAEKNLPEPVRQRMEKSVAVIAGQLLEGRKLTEVGQARADYAGIIQQVFDKVLVWQSHRCSIGKRPSRALFFSV